MTELGVCRLLANWVEWWKVLAVPNVTMSWGEIDLAVVTGANRLWEFEVKLTQSDWEADRKKPHRIAADDVLPNGIHPVRAGWWRDDRQRWEKAVSRFYYVYLASLKVPAWVPEDAGLIEVVPTERSWGVVNGHRLNVVRQTSTRRSALPLADAQVQAIAMKGARRLWMWGFRFIEPEIGCQPPAFEDVETEVGAGAP